MKENYGNVSLGEVGTFGVHYIHFRGPYQRKFCLDYGIYQY